MLKKTGLWLAAPWVARAHSTAWEFIAAQQARAAEEATVALLLKPSLNPLNNLTEPDKTPIKPATMNRMTSFYVWLQLFTACLVLGVNGKLVFVLYL